MLKETAILQPSKKDQLREHRGEFTYSLNRYNSTEDKDIRKKYARRMAKYIFSGCELGFSVEEVTQGQNYPETDVKQYIDDPSITSDPALSQENGVKIIEETVDTSNVIRHGDGTGIVYAYGYACLPDRLKVGSTEVDSVQRIAAQIKTSTPEKPCLLLEIKTDRCRALERAIHAVLDVRGRKISGGGAEWFKASRDEVIEIYKFVSQSQAVAP